MIYDNPLQTLNDDFMTILKSVVIKYKYLAVIDETFEMTKRVDQYIDAYYKKDVFDSYSYSIDDYTEVGIDNINTIRSYINDNSIIPKAVKESLLLNKREKTLNNYIEENNYYRMLYGLPDIDDNLFIYLSYDKCTEIGLSPTIPIHLVEKQAGRNMIDLIESRGWLNELIKDNPDKTYLKFIGSKSIHPVISRGAKNFELLYLTKDISEDLRDKFIIIYNQCREYFVKTIYMYQMSKMIDYYDNFIALCIMVMTMQQLVMKSIQYSIDRDFFNSYQIQALFETYDVPYFSSLDSDTQRNICNNINILIRDKGTNKIIYDLSKLLGFEDVVVYKYYLMKIHKLDGNHNPIFKTKTVYDESTGNTKEVYDYDEMYDIYFQKIDVKDKDVLDSLDDRSLREEYSSVTSGDPYWVVDDELSEQLYEREYNYKETKYLGMTIAYKLTDVLYDYMLLFREISYKKEYLKDIMVDLPSVSNDQQFNLFDTMTFLAALMSKKFNLKGEIVSKASQIYSVLETNEYIQDPKDGENDTFGFNFEFFNTSEYLDRKDEALSFMNDDDKKEFERYISTISLANGDPKDKIKAFNKMFENSKSLAIFLTRLMGSTDSYEAYKVYRRLYNTIFYVKETSKMFDMYDGSNPKYYSEYLLDHQPLLYNALTNTDIKDIHILISQVIDRIDNLILGLKNLQTINSSTSKVHDILISLIRFFKSYTTDMIGLNTIYDMNIKTDNLIRFFDHLERIIKSLEYNEDLRISYNDIIAKAIIYLRLKENNKLKDHIFTHVNINNIERLLYRDMCKILSEVFNMDNLLFKDIFNITSKLYYKDKFNIGFREVIRISLAISNVIDRYRFNDIITEIHNSYRIDENNHYYDIIGKLVKSINIKCIMNIHDSCIVMKNP